MPFASATPIPGGDHKSGCSANKIIALSSTPSTTMPSHRAIWSRMWASIAIRELLKPQNLIRPTARGGSQAGRASTPAGARDRLCPSRPHSPFPWPVGAHRRWAFSINRRGSTDSAGPSPARSPSWLRSRRGARATPRTRPSTLRASPASRRRRHRAPFPRR
jgi:hypothetical protein